MTLRKLATLMVPMIALCSCEDQTNPVEVTQVRELSSYDNEGTLKIVMPAEWRRVPSTRFRDYNCKFGKDGEVYISMATGGIKDNVDRWMRQFGQEPNADISTLEKIDMIGTQGVVIEAQGAFAGMGGISINDAALLGAMVENGGGLITVKMVATVDEVAQQRENFYAFCKSLEVK